MRFLHWLRQLICIHGPLVRMNFGWYEADGCARCHKIVKRYLDG